VSGVKTYKSDVARMAAASGDQVVRYLSEFFAAQGWIRQEKAKKGPDRLLTSRGRRTFQCMNHLRLKQ
jgi:hypothetical protein